MRPKEVHQFLTRFFKAHTCPIEQSDASSITVQLTESMDRQLMNRPFYWHYVKQSGQVGEPMKVTFITDQEQKKDGKKGEVIQFGSPRLHELFHIAQERGKFIRLYEEVQVTKKKSVPLYPWLLANVKISFQCDQKKDDILSIGLNLMHGQIVPSFYPKLRSIALTPKIPHFCFTFSPLITISSGLLRIRKIVQGYIHKEDVKWAERAREKMDEDLRLLEAFYEEEEKKPESYYVEKQSLRAQYEPHIVVEMINGGLFFLQQQYV